MRLIPPRAARYDFDKVYSEFLPTEGNWKDGPW